MQFLRALTASPLSIALLLSALALSPLMAQDTLPAPKSTPSDSPDSKESFLSQTSYCLGLDFGSNLQAGDIEIDIDALIEGMRDGLSKAQPKLTQAQITAVMDRFQQALQEKAEKKMAAAAAENLAKGKEFLTANRDKEGVIETPTGLQYKVLEEGDGPSPVETDTVRCHYEGTLIDGTVFDSSYKRGQPAEFPVRGVISGWIEALQMMNVGDKWEVYLPSEIAYQESGSPPVIGPNETLIFTIELLDIVQ